MPNDLEAYTYANQLVTILTMAGWDARGPELTVAADATAMGVSLYVRDPRTADAVKILIDAFNRFLATASRTARRRPELLISR